jgi:transposase-like protein
MFAIEQTAAPTFDAKLSKNGRTMRFICPHCRHTHQHEAEGAVVGEAIHRLAHCTVKNSPFTQTGYTLRPTR